MRGQRWILGMSVVVALISNAIAADLTAGLQLLDSSLSIEVFTEFTGAADCQGAQPPSPAEYGTAFYCEITLPWGNGFGTDALGRFYQIVKLPSPPFGPNTSAVHRNGPQGLEEIVRGGCNEFVDDDSITRWRQWYLNNLAVDAVNGRLYLAVRALTYDNHFCQGGPLAHRGGIVLISGLPSLLDIILSYQPPSTLSFNVPVRPEGLAGADSFSMYTGDVRAASDLTQAAPIECSVPAGRTPAPGEHLTVPDPLPDPAIGNARYYLAAVNYQGQRRAGRTSRNGVMYGRDAAALPACP